MTQVPAPRTDVRRPALLAAVPVALMWLLEAVDTVTGHALDALGLTAWSVADLPDVFTAPWVHLGWAHLAGNSGPLLVLGFLLALSGWRRWALTTLVVTLTSGLGAWLLSVPGSNTLGASGLVFGWLTYLLVRGFWTRRWQQVVVGLVVLVLFGGILWGVLPTTPGVSWQGHLGGAAGGVLAAWLAHGRRRTLPGDTRPLR